MSNLNLINLGKILAVEDNFADGFKVGNSETGAGGTSYKELLEKYGDAVNLTVSSSDDSDIDGIGHGLPKEKWGLCRFDLYSPRKWRFPLE